MKLADFEENFKFIVALLFWDYESIANGNDFSADYP